MKEPSSIEELKQAVVGSVASVEVDVLEKVIDKFVSSYIICKNVSGHHFQHI